MSKFLFHCNWFTFFVFVLALYQYPCTAQSSTESSGQQASTVNPPPDVMQELEAMKRMNPKSPAELAEEDALEKFLKGEDIEPQPEHKHH